MHNIKFGVAFLMDKCFGSAEPSGSHFLLTFPSFRKRLWSLKEQRAFQGNQDRGENPPKMPADEEDATILK